jgi:hypothetical protein
VQGKRIYPSDPSESLPPGGYAFLDYVGNADGLRHQFWVAETPNGHGANLGSHSVIEHEDGTITVWPSIRITTSYDGGKTEVELWRGYLERGIWRTC